MKLLVLNPNGSDTVTGVITESARRGDLDPVAVGVKVAESLVGLRLCHSKARRYAHPSQPLEHYL